MKELASELKSKCDLAIGKIDLEHGQHQKHGTIWCHYWQGCIQVIPLIFYLRVNIWVGLLDLGIVDRELMRKVGMSLL